jgi:hypothetical protein
MSYQHVGGACSTSPARIDASAATFLAPSTSSSSQSSPAVLASARSSRRLTARLTARLTVALVMLIWGVASDALRNLITGFLSNISFGG